MLSPAEMRKLLNKCRRLEKGPDYRCQDYVQNLHLTALDFQMPVSVVNASLQHFATNHRIRTHARLRRLVDSYPATKEGNRCLANSLWGNNHWTRAEYLRCVMDYFEEHGVRGQRTLSKWARTS